MKRNPCGKQQSPGRVRIIGWVAWIVMLLFVLNLPGVLVRLGAAAQKTHKNKYGTIEVFKFDIRDGINVPANFMGELQTALVAEFKLKGKFKEVLSEGDTPATATAPVLRLTGTMTKREPGSPVIVTVHVRWLDHASGELISEEDVRSKVVLGGGGIDNVQVIGDTIRVSLDEGPPTDYSALVEKIVKITDKKFF